MIFFFLRGMELPNIRFLSSPRSRPSSRRPFYQLVAHGLCLATLLYGPPSEAIEVLVESRRQLEVVDEMPRRETTPRTTEAAHATAAIPHRDALTGPETIAPQDDVPIVQLPTLDDSTPPIRYGGQPDPPPSLPGFDGADKALLSTGWNLVSTPSDPASPAPADVLAPVADTVERAMWWDACATTPGWREYSPTDPASATLDAIDSTRGIWLSSTDGGDLPTDGTPADFTSIALCPGWNLIGFPAGQERHVQSVLAPIADKYERVFAYDPARVGDPWQIYDVRVPEWANDLETMRPGRGYWILVTEAATLDLRNDGTPPTASLTAPNDLAVITEPTAITGTITSELLDSWTLSQRLVGQTDWSAIESKRFPVDGELATFDPTREDDRAPAAMRRASREA